jgi:hypothetical protein
MERTMRIVARMFEQNGTLFIGAAIAVVLLILLVIVSRRMRRAQPAQSHNTAAIKDPMLQGDIELSMIDETFDKTFDENFDENLDGPNTANSAAGNAIAPDELDAAAAHQFDIDGDVMDDIDDITIPKVGEAPPPRKSRFFSAAWLHRDKADEDAVAAEPVKAPDSATLQTAAECSRLAEIERNMLALRELYEAGLIAPEVYVLKAREFAALAA